MVLIVLDKTAFVDFQIGPDLKYLQILVLYYILDLKLLRDIFSLYFSESYLLHGSIKKHFLFCQCEMCLRKPISFIINSAKMVGKINLMKSSLRRGDLSESNPGCQKNMKEGAARPRDTMFYPYKMEEKFDINVWKMNSVEWIVDSIEKRRRHRHRIEQMEFVHDREPEDRIEEMKFVHDREPEDGIEQMEFVHIRKPGYNLPCPCLAYGSPHKI